MHSINLERTHQGDCLQVWSVCARRWALFLLSRMVLSMRLTSKTFVLFETGIAEAHLGTLKPSPAACTKLAFAAALTLYFSSECTEFPEHV
jgi:hypothetical protein